MFLTIASGICGYLAWDMAKFITKHKETINKDFKTKLICHIIGASFTFIAIYLGVLNV